jgi:hypothetical protein
MGRLHIGHEASVTLDDELLEHVFAVIVTKLRRHEPVLLEWQDADGHSEQLLVGTTALVRAELAGPRPDQLDHAWLESIMLAANSNGGISLSVADLSRHTRTVPTPLSDLRDRQVRIAHGPR